MMYERFKHIMSSSDMYEDVRDTLACDLLQQPMFQPMVRNLLRTGIYNYIDRWGFHVCQNAKVHDLSGRRLSRVRYVFITNENHICDILERYPAAIIKQMTGEQLWSLRDLVELWISENWMIPLRSGNTWAQSCTYMVSCMEHWVKTERKDKASEVFLGACK